MAKIKKIGVVITLILSITLSFCLNSIFSSAAKTKQVLKQTKLTLNVKQSAKLKLKISLKKIKWKSSNKRIATVTKQGKVTGCKAGVTKIKVYGVLKNGKKVSSVCQVTVRKKKPTTATIPPTIAPTNTPSASATTPPSTAPSSAPSTAPTQKPPISSTNPTATDAPSDNPVIAYRSVQGTMRSCSLNSSSLLNQKINDNQVIKTYAQLDALISEINALEYKTSDIIEFIETLQTYSEDYFSNNVLCLGNLELTEGYSISLDFLTKQTLSDNTYRLKVKVTKTWTVKEGEAVPSVMRNHICIIEMTTLDGGDLEEVIVTPAV